MGYLELLKTMKIFLALFLLCSAEAFSQSKITVQVSNFKNNKGVCRACIFNSEASFNDSKALQCVEVFVTNKAIQASFENIAEGTYAIFVIHDANSNNKMDKNFLGIPSEGYGASRNNLPFASAPSFDGNKFTVTKGFNYTFKIRLRNL
jgi:uncharacterized protein (DUF2141 family)